MKIAVIHTQQGPVYFNGENQQVTWRDIQAKTGLDRSLSRLLLKKLAASGEDVEDLREWRDKNVLVWKLEQDLGIAHNYGA